MKKKRSLLLPRVLIALVTIMGLVLAWRVAAKKETVDPTSYSFLPFTWAVAPEFSLSPVGEGFNFVTAITHAGDDRIFVAELAGVIKVLHPDGHASVFLDISDQVTTGGSEYGFYHLIFHPGYHDPGSPGYGAFYVSYSRGPEEVEPSDVDLVFSKFRVWPIRTWPTLLRKPISWSSSKLSPITKAARWLSIRATTASISAWATTRRP